jgi:lysozyme family protein
MSLDDIYQSMLNKPHNNNISKETVKEIFDTLQLEKIREKMLVEEILDSSLNTGIENAVKIVQNSYNILTVKGKKLKVDGVMGHITIKALNTYKNPLELFVWINMNQFNYYKEHNASSSFMKEWINDRVIGQVQDYFVGR